MTHTATSSRDAVATLINTAWLADSLTQALEMQWDDVDSDPPSEDPGANGLPVTWARTTIRTLVSSTESLGGIGIGKMQSDGLVVVQTFTPPGDGHDLSDQIGEILKRAVRGRQVGDLWFFDVVYAEFGRDRVWERADLRAGFRYTEQI